MSKRFWSPASRRTSSLLMGPRGGTGAAPLEFADDVGMSLPVGLWFVHNALVGAGLRDRIRAGVSGKIVSGFDMACVMALGADYCNAALDFMFAVGCIHAQSCHSDKYPVGVTSQNPARWRAIVAPDKATRVAHFHKATVEALAKLVGAAGLSTYPRALASPSVSTGVTGRIRDFRRALPVA